MEQLSAAEEWGQWLAEGLASGRLWLRSEPSAAVDDAGIGRALHGLAMEDRAERIAAIGALYDTYDEAMADWRPPVTIAELRGESE